MKQLLFFIFFLASGTAFSQGAGVSKPDFEKYVSDCKKMFMQSQPNKDSKDVDMLCRDPYLKGKPNESREDKVRRQRLLRETNEAKRSALEKLVDKDVSKQTDIPEGMSKPEYDDYMKNCKKMVLESDPGRDPQDAHMLCSDPYLKGKPNESYDDQVRRKRLIKEAGAAKGKALEKRAAPSAIFKSSGNGVR
ncbi:hypothetical protein [Bdellovibrio sp. HCB-110]|uniref:hypothetical protein n=1 Tax=Bdellovibrio sp. HCB-110 TaxID=3391182 RepID=UPI0039B6B4D7